MRLDAFNRLLQMQASRRSILKGAAGAGAVAALGSAGLLGPMSPFTGTASAQELGACRNPEDPRRRQGFADGCRLAEGRRDVPWADQGNVQGRRIRRGRADLHGPQQPEPPQPPVPRLPEAVGDLYRRQDQLDRPRPGRLQSAPAAVDRHRHGGLRHHRDGRALRGRHRRQGPARRDARLGEDPDRHGRLRQLPEAAGRHMGRQDLSHHHRWRLPYLLVSHRLLRRRFDQWHGRSADDLGRGRRGHQESERPDGSAHRSRCLRLPRPAEVSVGRVRLLLPRGSRGGLCQVSRRSGLAVRAGHHEADGQQSGLGAGDPGRAGSGGHRRLSGRPGQRRPQRHRPSSNSWPAPAPCSAGGATSVRTSRRTIRLSSATSPVSRSTRAASRSTTPRPASGRRRTSRTSRRTWPISAGASTSPAGFRRREEAHGGMERRGSSRRQGSVAVVCGLSVRLPALPEQPFQHRGMGRRRLRCRLHQRLPRVGGGLLQSPQRRHRAANSGHLPVLLDRGGRVGQGRSTASTRRLRRPRTRLRPPGKRSPTRSAAKARSSSTRLRLACSRGRISGNG